MLGISSIIKAFPYEVPPFIPAVLIECMSKHAASPVPLSTTVRATLAEFKRTHADSWETDQKAFSAEQLADLQDLLTGSVRTLFNPCLSGCLFLLLTLCRSCPLLLYSRTVSLPILHA